MSWKSIVENVGARGLKDVLNPALWRAYAEWSEIEKNGIDLAAEDILSFAEQICYRLYQCSDCVAAGKCWHCKCPQPAKVLTPKAFCSNLKWAAIMSNNAWEVFKKGYHLQFFVQRGGAIDDFPAFGVWKEVTEQGIHLTADEILSFCEQIVAQNILEKDEPLKSPKDWDFCKKFDGFQIVVIKT